MRELLSAVYLAAGEGSRLRPLTSDRPKAMIDLGGVSLAERALRHLRKAGIEEIVAVTGHRAKALDELGELVTRQIANPRYADAGNLYSLWCARELVEEGCYVVNSDVLFEEEVGRRLVGLEESALLCDASHGPDAESMKAVARDGRLRVLSKQAPADSNLEYIGLARIDPDHGPLLVEILERSVERGAVSDYYEAAIEELAQQVPVKVARIDGFAWIEIDDHDDLARARDEVLERVG